MKKKLLFLIAILLFAISSNLFSAPAYPYPITKKQSNGKTITFTLKGDEYIKWAKTIDDYTLLGNRQGEYVYAIIDEKKNLVPSNVLASNPEERSIEEKLFLNSIQTNLFFSQSQLNIVSQNRASRIESTSIERTPTTGTPNFLVILVNYADVSFNSSNIATIENMISQANYTTSGATGSVKDYFYDNSIGLLNANFTVVGPFTLSHNAAYYGSNIGGVSGDDTLPQAMMLEAATLADASVNFADYDNDNDGSVDMVHIVYPGRGEHNGGGANAIWAHSWSFPYPTYMDGVLLNKYSCSPELQSNLSVDGIGTICHEMGHVLGLPDFYDTDYGGSGGTAIHLGSWDLMASGNYNNSSMTPPYLSALERKMLGWKNYNYLISTSSCSLNPIADSAKSYRINLSSNEYLILENRHKKKWDNYIPSEGMLIFHADSTKISARYDINVIPSDRGFFIEPSTGDYTNDSYNTRTPFPGANNVKNYTTITTPYISLKSGAKVYNKSLTNIRNINDSTITFDFQASIPVVITKDTLNVTSSSADLNGLIVHRGTSTITQKGFYWSTVQANCNSIDGNTVISTSTDTLIYLNATGLTSGSTIYYRAFATNSSGTGVGDIKSFALVNSSITSFPWTNGFENDFTYWTTQLVSGTVNWVIGTSLVGAAVTTPYSGTKYAKFYIESSTAYTARLISPVFDFTNINNPYLSYYYVNPQWSSDLNTLKIYYRTSGIGAWTLIKTLHSNITNWTRDSIYLPNPSSTYQIAFEGINDFGYQTGIDEVKIENFVLPTVTTNSATSITKNSAQLSGSVVAGTETVSNKGFEWKLSSASTWNIVNSPTMSYSLTGLSPYTTYNVRAFATTGLVTTYGNTNSFRTLHQPPTITTLSPSSITQTSAILNGTIVQGTETINAKGFEIKLSSSSTWTIINVSDPSLIYTKTGLSPNTSYNVRAFVTTDSGTIYGLVENFTTLHQPPTLTTNQPTNITQTTATLNGTIIVGTETITTKVFQYKEENSGTWLSASATGTTSIYSNITGLIANTNYKTRVKVSTASGDYYGDSISFTTISHIPPTISSPIISNITQTTAQISGTINSGTQTINAKGFEWKISSSSIWTTVNNEALSYQLTNLSPNTSYDIRLFATTSSTTTYGSTQSFTTLHTPPTAITNQPTNLTPTTVTLNGTITIGTEPITGRVFQYKLGNTSSWISVIASGTTTIYVDISNLSPQTLYKTRAVVSTSSGSYYGDSISFTTPSHTPPTISSPLISDITQTTVQLTGTINSGTQIINAKGFEWKISSSSIWTTVNNEALSYQLTNLSPNTSYDIRLFATTLSGTTYGTIESLTTLHAPPTVTTNNATNLSQTTAVLNGYLSLGTETIISKGFQYKTLSSSSWTYVSATGINNLSASISGLSPLTQYQVYVLVSTASGVYYGDTLIFSTLNIVPPSIITNSVSSITQTSSLISGSLTLGSEAIISKGFEWKLSSSSTWNIINDEDLSYALTGLSPYTSYYVRVFATTASGISYGNIESFTTQHQPHVITLSVSNITQVTANLNATLTQGTQTILSKGFQWKENSSSLWTKINITGNNLSYILEGLSPNSSYNSRAFVETATDTVYSSIENFTTIACSTIYANPINAEICQGQTYSLNGFNASTQGQHTLTLQNINGCDSVLTLNLIVNQPQITNLSAEICQGETYNLNGFNTSTAGLHTLNLQTYKGCDSIVNLNLIVNQPQITNLEAEICQGQTYTLNGFNTSTAGLHILNLQTYKGCDSTVNLNLIVNQPKITNLEAEICQGSTYTLNGFITSIAGQHTLNLQTYKGCDSTVNLNLIVNQPAITNLTAEICQGTTYTLNGFNTSTAGLHTLNLQTYKGCDSTVNLNLIVNQPQITNLSAEICQGQTYNLNGFNTSTAGLHTLNLQTYKGCDSTVNLNLIVNQPAITNLVAEICQGQTYNLNGFNTSTVGLHTLNLQTYKGCDSTVNLNLIINQPAITNLVAEICQGGTYHLNGFNTNIQGLHILNLQTYKGCDSTVSLNLIVNQPAITNLTAEICQGQTYNLNGFNTSTQGLHTLNLQTYKGCDSTVNLNLIVNQPQITNIEAEICQGQTYNLNGFNTSTAGLHTLNLQTYKGCDSTVNLNLIVNQPANTNFNASICQGETYLLNGFNESISGTYYQNLQTINGCDSTVSLVLVVNSVETPSNLLIESSENHFIISWHGDGNDYVIYRNNDSIARVSDTIYNDNDLVIGENYCYKIKSISGDCESELSNEACRLFSNLEDININNLRVYPNPANNYVIIEGEGIEEIGVYNINGQKIYSEKVNNQESIKVNTSNYLPGTYSFKIIFLDGNVSNKKVIIAR